MRRLLTLAAVLSLAFAPAPLPRPAPREEALTAESLAGTWRVTALYHPPDKTPKDPAGQGVTHVVITATQWAFEGSGAARYDLRIDNSKKPAEFDMMQVGQKMPYGRGLMRREGAGIRVVYRWSGTRPASFDDPAAGCDLTLVRENAPAPKGGR